MARRFVAGAAIVLLVSVAAPISAAAPAAAASPSALGFPAFGSFDFLGWNPDTEIYQMIFPIEGDNSYGDTWGACRDGCSRTHEGTDIFAAKMTPVVAVADGTVGWMNDTQGGNCCAMALNHDDGWASWSIHLNNDTPGTDDGQGWGFAPGITTGVHVVAGQLIGYVGDSGNAENSSPHVHFELHQPDGTKINPYPHLQAAEQIDGGTPGAVAFSSYRVDDGPEHDGTGNDSRGNNDGLAQCGETIELYVTAANDGEGPLSGLAASLSESDPYVTLLYNSSSDYPTIAPGETAENDRDWDLRISADAPGGHQFLASFTFTADVGGPWIVDVTIPIECGVDITPPELTSLTPQYGSFAVPTGVDVIAMFSEPVDPTTVTGTSFTLEDGSMISGAVGVAGDGMSATFDPDVDLATDTVYTVSLTSGITDLAGNPLTAVASSFSTGDIVPGSIVDISYRVDDGPAHDGTGNDSIGNNDGLAQCGETIELYITVRNEGDLVVVGLSSGFSESDPYVRLLYNINSPYPELPPGASAENLGDWDLRIEPDTPSGYSFTATVSFSVLNPVTLALVPIDSVVDVEVPIECEPPSVSEVSVGTDVTITFSKPVDPATVTTDTFRLSEGGPLSGEVSVAGDGMSATFDPDADLAHETVYAVTATDGITSIAGNLLVPFASSFTTQAPDTTAPLVEGIVPADGAQAVDVAGDITVTFSEPVNPATVTSGSFTVSNGGPVAGIISVAGNGLTATLDPDGDLAYQTLYSVVLSDGVTDLAGNPLVPFASSFTMQDPEPDPGVPVLVSYRVDDGPFHDGTGNDSQGNNDGLAQCGETIELYVTVRNDGELALTGLSGTLAESDAFVSLLYNTSSGYPSLGAGVSGENPLDWDLRISPDTPDGHLFVFTVTYTAAGGGSWPIEVTIPIACGSSSDPGVPVLVSYGVDDGPFHDGTGNDSQGNNDGLAQCGETIELYVTVRNDGELALTGLSGTLAESDAFVSLLYNTSSGYPSLGAGVSGENPLDWDLRISPDTPDGHLFVFTVTYTAAGGGSWPIEVTIPIACP